MKHVCAAIFSVLFGICAQAQEYSPKRNLVVEQLIEVLASSQGEDVELDYNTLFDDLVVLLDQPLDINSAQAQDFERLYLLNSIQIAAILKHRERYKKFVSVYELQAVDGLELDVVRYILPFVKVREGIEKNSQSLVEQLAEGKHSLLVRWQDVLEDQRGFGSQEGAPAKFLGTSPRVYARYQYNMSNKLRIGFTAEKDPGEELFAGTQKSFDFLSGHVYYAGKGIVKQAVVGDYQLQFGQGLALLSGLGFGKSIYAMDVKKNRVGIRPYTSVDENRFLRGSAATVGVRDFRVTGFYSQKKIDANFLEGDTLSDDIPAVSRLFGSGFHRTATELEDKDAVAERHYGGRLGWEKSQTSFGVSVVQNKFDADLQPRTGLGDKFDFSGSENQTYSIDGASVVGNFNFFGEAAQSQNGGRAYLVGALAALHPQLSVSILHRDYDKDFQTLLGNAFGEGSSTNNEKGTFFGVKYKPSRKWELLGYYDQFAFSWLRFRVSSPSRGHDGNLQLAYRPNRGSEFYIRLRRKIKERNTTSTGETEIRKVEQTTQTNFRLHASFKASETLTLKTRVEHVWFDQSLSESERGFLLYQDLSYKKLGSPFTFSMRYALFDTDSFDSRLYAFESDILYAYSIPAYYRTGSRFYGMVKYKLGRHLDLWLRYSQWRINGVQTFSSGDLEIAKPTKSEVKVQLRLKF